MIESIEKLSADERIKLIQYAYDRLNRALEKIDDSGGYRFHLENMLHEALVKCFHESAQTNKQKVAFLARQLAAPADVYPAIPGDFIREEDTELFELFIEYCEAQWGQLLKQCELGEPHKLGHHPLSYILLDHARDQKNPLREIEILTATANTFMDYSALSEKFVELNQLDKAEKWLKKAENSDQSGLSGRLLPLKIRIDIARGAFKSALNKQWKLYSTNANNAHYDQLLMLYQKNGLREKSCYEKAEKYLLSLVKNRPGYPPVPSSLLIEFYLHQNESDKAVDFARNAPVEAYLLSRIALSITKNEPQTAIDFNMRSATSIAIQANNHAYDEAVDILVKLASVLEPKWKTVYLQSVAQLREVASLRRKPNFIKALDRKFPLPP